MDISNEYVEMCEKAQEIQALESEYDQKYSIIPNLFATHKGKGQIGYGEAISKGYVSEDQEAIWLPRQDQLQEMIWNNVADVSFQHPPFLGHQYINCTYFVPFEKRFVQGSFEQCWLQIVMKVKYNKVWDNVQKEWVNRG